jgi:hypothetical protein
MLAGPQPFSLRLERPLGPGFAQGGLVSVRVLESLGAGRWLVSVRGRTLPVSAEVQLSAGARLLARVQAGGGRIALRVLAPAGQGGAAEAGGGAPAAERIGAALLAAGIHPRPDAVQKVRRLLEKLRLPEEGYARLAAMLLRKGVELDSPGLAALLADLSYGRGRGREQPRRRAATAAKQAAGQAAAAEDAAAEAAEGLRRGAQNAARGGDSALPLFNHLQPGREQWFVIPYSHGGAGGTIRLRRTAPDLQADRLVLATDGPWCFLLNRSGGGLRLQALCAGPPPGPRARRAWRLLAQKLQNLGVETDDTIRGDQGFDGFSLPGEAGPHQRVDTEG